MKKIVILLLALCSGVVLSSTLLCACTPNITPAPVGAPVASEPSINAAESSVTVPESAVAPENSLNLTISPTSVSIFTGDKQKLRTKLNDSDISPTKFSWKSSDEKIAVVNATTGEVTGKTVGSCTIIATYIDNGTQLTADISVMQKATSSEPSQTSKKQESSKAQQSSQKPVERSYAQVSKATPTPSYSNSIYSIFGTTDSDPSYNKYVLDHVHDYIYNIIMNNSYIPVTQLGYEGLTDDQAQMLINTIYATYDYSFATDYIANGYFQCSWYYAGSRSQDAIRSTMSEVQKDNIDNLSTFIKNY